MVGIVFFLAMKYQAIGKRRRDMYEGLRDGERFKQRGYYYYYYSTEKKVIDYKLAFYRFTEKDSPGENHRSAINKIIYSSNIDDNN